MDALGNILLLAAIVAALVYWLGFSAREAPGRRGGAVKAASTGLLAVFLIPAAGTFPGFWPIPLGLGLGAVGDWFLARRGERAFLAGMAAFGLGHLAYAGALLARSSALGFDGLSGPEWAALALLLALAGSTELWLAPRAGGLKGPVRAYVAPIALMGAAAVLMPANPGQGMLRIGAGLFLASDLMLALRLFVVQDKVRQKALSLALWPAYWVGQALIGWGALLFWAYPKG